MKSRRYDPATEILSAIGGSSNGALIRAYFESGKEGVYSSYMMALLKTDPEVACITSEETGEVLYAKI